MFSAIVFVQLRYISLGLVTVQPLKRVPSISHDTFEAEHGSICYDSAVVIMTIFQMEDPWLEMLTSPVPIKSLTSTIHRNTICVENLQSGVTKKWQPHSIVNEKN